MVRNALFEEVTFELRAIDGKDAAMQRSAEDFFFFTLRNYKSTTHPGLVETSDY